jgi:hypothetical protein
MTGRITGTSKAFSHSEELWDREDPEVSPLGGPQVVPLRELPRLWGLVGMADKVQLAGALPLCGQEASSKDG